MVTYFLLSHNNWLRGQAVKTSPFHGGNTGSIPVGVIIRANICEAVSGKNRLCFFSDKIEYGAVAKR